MLHLEKNEIKTIFLSLQVMITMYLAVASEASLRLAQVVRRQVRHL